MLRHPLDDALRTSEEPPRAAFLADVTRLWPGPFTSQNENAGLKVISPASTQATSSLSRCRWKRLLVPTDTVSSNSMMLSLASWPRSFKAAKRPGVVMSRCFPPPAGTTKPFVSVMLVSSLWRNEDKRRHHEHQGHEPARPGSICPRMDSTRSSAP